MGMSKGMLVEGSILDTFGLLLSGLGSGGFGCSANWNRLILLLACSFGRFLARD